jgi:hypothetical protein
MDGVSIKVPYFPPFSKLLSKSYNNIKIYKNKSYSTLRSPTLPLELSLNSKYF